MEYVFVVGIICLTGLLLLLEFFYLFIMSKQTEEWLCVEGKIDKSKMDVYYGYDANSYKTNVQYQYIVEEKKYVSKRIYYGDYTLKTFPCSVKKIVNKYTKGKTVLVYYNPQHPNKSVLETGVHTVIYRGLVAGILVLLLSVVMFLKESFFTSFFQ